MEVLNPMVFAGNSVEQSEEIKGGKKNTGSEVVGPGPGGPYHGHGGVKVTQFEPPLPAPALSEVLCRDTVTWPRRECQAEQRKVDQRLNQNTAKTRKCTCKSMPKHANIACITFKTVEPPGGSSDDRAAVAVLDTGAGGSKPGCTHETRT